MREELATAALEKWYRSGVNGRAAITKITSSGSMASQPALTTATVIEVKFPNIAKTIDISKTNCQMLPTEGTRYSKLTWPLALGCEHPQTQHCMHDHVAVRSIVSSIVTKPLDCRYAMTVHKVQGSTIHGNAIVDVTHAFAAGAPILRAVCKPTPESVSVGPISMTTTCHTWYSHWSIARRDAVCGLEHCYKPRRSVHAS